MYVTLRLHQFAIESYPTYRQDSLEFLALIPLLLGVNMLVAGLASLISRVLQPGGRRSNLTAKEIAEREGGRRGEAEVRQTLAGMRGYKVYHGVHVRSQGSARLPRSQEFDHIVVGPTGVFNIETKNWRGKIVIDEAHNWFRESEETGSRRPWGSPVEQIKRHQKVLQSVLRDIDAPIFSLLVMTNPSTNIQGLRHAGVRIVRVENLRHAIKNWRAPRKLSPLTRYRINRHIRANIIGRSWTVRGTLRWRWWHWLFIDAIVIIAFYSFF